MSVVSLGSAVEELLVHAGGGDKAAQLPIRLSRRQSLNQSPDDTQQDQLNSREIRASSPSTRAFSPCERSPFVSNRAFSSHQEYFDVPAFPPASPTAPAALGTRSSSRRGSGQLVSAPDLSAIAVVSPARDGSGSSSRKGSDELVNIGASSRGPELFMDVARLTSMQVEKDRAIGRAQDARSKGLATESIPTRNARIASNRRQSVDKANSNLANPESFHKHGRIDANIASAMASFGISYDGPTRPVEDNKPSPHDVNETEKERKRAEHKRRKRMRRQLEHERVIRETPMEEYS